ncbi:amidohydrolase family protein [Synoicihabitans lomoniglobus]|uniref:Amidohydrolase family protein n=1 Tax=Synoicihabitans lomoniglobus TaxID=2909285 RepID=A0AAF0CR96_9BACT|nr:amidohydrolase family protein [Opitutaceae bacterium LMO-M01]WED66624.1 amidohydrolase family protein [Opitutaceae bacterium LMO-M01]
MIRRSLLRALPLACLAAMAFSADATLLVSNATLITMADDQPDPFVGWFTVGSDGRIIALAPGAPPDDVAATTTIDATEKLVAPGFISAHSHIFMSPLRGLGHDVTLYGWFRAWDRYLRHSTAEDIYWFTLHGSLDFLRNGITTAYDFSYNGGVGPPAIGLGEVVPPPRLKPGPFEQNQIEARIDAGLRSIDSIFIFEFDTLSETRAHFETLLDYGHTKAAENDLLLKMAISGRVQFEPHKSTAFMEATFMRDYGLLNQSHFLESPERVPEQQQKFEWYVEAGALGPQLIFGHFIQVNDHILDTVAASGAKMSWQPTSNGRLADGIADVVEYRRRGIPVAVGLDDQSCTDVSDPWQNLRIGLYTMRGLHEDATVLSVHDMLRLHTLGSAEVLEIDDDVGSLEPGKFADFLIVNPRHPDTGPVYDPLATYVLATSLRNLEQVYVGGKLVADGLTFPGHDEARLRREIDTRTDRLRAFAIADDFALAAANAQREGDPAAAITHYTAAIAAAPGYADPYIDRGLTHFGQRDYAAAAADFKAAVAADPTSARALIYRGDLAYRYIEGDFAACAADYARALAIDPQFHGYHAYTAELYLYSGEPARAVAEAAQGMAREPASLIHQINLAHGLLFTGDVAAAQRIYVELSDEEIAPGRKGAAFALGDFRLLAEKGAVTYPEIAKLTPWLKTLVRP